MFRFVAFLLVAFAIGSLLFGSGAAGAAALGVAVLTAMFFVVKLLFFFMLLGFIGKMFFARGGRSHPEWRGGWCGPGYRRPADRPTRRSEDPVRSQEDEFDEWHRLAHAKEEVDGWVPEVE